MLEIDTKPCTVDARSPIRGSVNATFQELVAAHPATLLLVDLEGIIFPYPFSEIEQNLQRQLGRPLNDDPWADRKLRAAANRMRVNSCAVDMIQEFIETDKDKVRVASASEIDIYKNGTGSSFFEVNPILLDILDRGHRVLRGLANGSYTEIDAPVAPGTLLVHLNDYTTRDGRVQLPQRLTNHIRKVQPNIHQCPSLHVHLPRFTWMEESSYDTDLFEAALKGLSQTPALH